MFPRAVWLLHVSLAGFAVPCCALEWGPRVRGQHAACTASWQRVLVHNNQGQLAVVCVTARYPQPQTPMLTGCVVGCFALEQSG